MTIGKVLFLAHPSGRDPWYSDYAAQLDPGYDLVLYDPDRSFADQVAGAGVVVEVGGAIATPPMIQAARQAGVRLWQIMGTGLDHVHVDEYHRLGLPLANTPGGASAVALAEHALFLMMCIFKQLNICADHVRRGEFFVPINRELSGSILLIVGLGASGLALSRRAADLGMVIYAAEARPLSDAEIAAARVSQVVPPERLAELVPLADVVSLHAPLTRTTRHLVDSAFIDLLRPGAVLVNVARGELVDEAALVAALGDGRLAGAGLDVFAAEPLPADHPFLSLDNVVLTPHVAGATDGTSRRRAELAVSNTERTFRGEQPEHLV